MSKFLESVDSFGHAIEFTLNEREGTYKTKLGGFVTILLNSLILQQTILRFGLMFNYQNDTLTNSDSSTDFNTLGKVSVDRIKDTLPLFVFQRTMTDGYYFRDDE